MHLFFTEGVIMGHIVRRVPWCDIDINTTSGHIFLQQKWNYTWLTKTGISAWTAREKTDFHNRADTYIWAAWSNRVTLGVSGASSFSRRYGTRGVSINLDIRRVTSNAHWKVNVNKISTTDFARSNVIWNTRIINLDTNDFNTRTNCRGTPRRCHNQIPVAHEFGHAAGNTAVLSRGDEYRTTSPHTNDHASIMNVGSQLRNRHFRTIIDELNLMIPDTIFTVKTIIS
jgi:hypothetical protein